MIKFLRSPWVEDFGALVDAARTSLIISSPYVGREPCNWILAAKSSAGEINDISILLLTDLSPDKLLSGATDASAICDLADTFPRAEIRFLPSIHAKVYIADDLRAIVTSANMTKGGLVDNYEYGVVVDDTRLVRRIRSDLTQYAALGTRIDRTKLKALLDMSSDLRRLRVEAQKSLEKHVRKELQRRLKMFDEEIIRARADGRAPHAIFAEAILYLLARKPMSTAELHPLIQGIHPDLCDDTVDRVIDGKHFGKKWKHAVRTAQQHLKKAGKIELVDGVWYLRKK